MKVIDIVTRVRNSAGDINVMQFSDQVIYDWLNDGIREVSIANSLLQKTATSNLVIGQQDYTLPVDILKLYSVRIDNEKIRILTLEEWETMNAGEAFTTNDTGSAYQGYIWAGVLKLWPVPDSVKQLQINYLYAPVTIAVQTAGSIIEPAIPQIYHLRLISYCLAQAALQDGDLQAYQMHLNAFESGNLALKDSETTPEDLYPFTSISPRDMGSDWDCYYG